MTHQGMLIVWYLVRDEREAIVIPVGIEHVSRYDCQYAMGFAAPHYPLPTTEAQYAQAL